MARWIIQRPQEHSHPAEIRVAEQLRELDDQWTVISETISDFDAYTWFMGVSRARQLLAVILPSAPAG